MTSEKPLLFNDLMVSAILKGRKTQTRRVVKPGLGRKRPILNLKDHGVGDYSGDFNDPWSWGYPFAEDGCDMPLAGWPELCPHGQPGDQLWVKETWQAYRQTSIEYDEWEPLDTPKDRHNDIYTPVYRADRKNFPEKWMPSIFMPREFSRIDLRITAVKVERLQDISEADAEAEGIRRDLSGWEYHGEHWATTADGKNAVCWETAKGSYAQLWKSINDKPGTTWDENPWVWAITFERVKP